MQESKEAVPQGCIRDNTTGQEVPANAPPAQAIQVHKGIFFLSRKIGKKFFFLFSLNRGEGDVVAYLTFFKYFFQANALHSHSASAQHVQQPVRGGPGPPQPVSVCGSPKRCATI